MVNARPEHRQDHPSSLHRGPTLFVPAVLVALTVSLRLWHLDHGLPDFLEEAIPFKKALAMWGWETGHTDLNPHFFNYPTLAIYLHFFVQKLHYAFGLLAGTYSVPADYWLLYQLDPTPQVVAARLVGVCADGATVLGVWVIGERLRRGVGVVAALLVACAPTMVLTGRAIYTDSVMLALATWAVERLLKYQALGGRGRLLMGVILIGLAAGAKYTAGLLVLPLGWTLWIRHGRRGLLWWPVTAAASTTVFLLSSPYVALDFGSFWQDFNYERQHMAVGHLGSLDERGAGFQLRTLVNDLGVPALLCLLITLLGTLRRRREADVTALVTLWLALLPHAASVAWFRMEAARYLLPLLPSAAVLIGWGGWWTLSLSDGRWRRFATIAVLGLVLIPALRGGLAAAAGGSVGSRQLAREWCEQNLTLTDLIVQESYGAPLHDLFELELVRRNPSFPMARPEIRNRFAQLRWFRTVALPMATSGTFRFTAQTRAGNKLSLTIFPHASELNQVFYTPSLYHEVDFFIASNAVRQRYLDNPARFPLQVTFYRLLAEHATEAARFRPGRGVTGPEVTIYDLRGAWQEYLRQHHPRFDPYWWANVVPADFRTRADSLLAPPSARSHGQVQLPDGRPATWVLSLERPFNGYILPYLLRMAHHLSELQRFPAGRRHAAAILAMRSDLEIPCLIYSNCATQMGDWSQAQRAVTSCLKVNQRDGKNTDRLRFELARILSHLGQREAATHELELILQSAPPASELATQARRILSTGVWADSSQAAP